ncbi:MAG: hypothetical protein ABJ327_10355 [Litoreibacter sp.]
MRVEDVNISDSYQKQEFQERVERIQDTHAHLMQEMARMKPQLTPVEEMSLKYARNAGYPLSIIGAFALGMLSVLVGQFVRVNLVGLGNQDNLWLALADLAMASMIIFSVRNMFRLPIKELLTAQTIGITVMFLCLHNFVHVAPFPFAVLMSPEWVDAIRMDTHFGSIRLGTFEIPVSRLFET